MSIGSGSHQDLAWTSVRHDSGVGGEKPSLHGGRARLTTCGAARPVDQPVDQPVGRWAVALVMLLVAVIAWPAWATDDPVAAVKTPIAGMDPGRSPSDESLAAIERMIMAAQAATDDVQRRVLYDTAFNRVAKVLSELSVLDYLVTDVRVYRMLGLVSLGRSDASLSAMAHAEIMVRLGDREPDGDTAATLAALREHTTEEHRDEQLKATLQFFELLARARDGDSESQLAVATYVGGRPSPERHEAEKLLWLEAAATEGNVEAMSALGLARHGREEYVEALRWFRKAAERGDPSAMVGIAVCLGHGQGVERDDVAATQWLTRAAEAGDPAAQFRLSYWLEAGDRVEADPIAARLWRRRAAEGGHLDAQRVVAGEYHWGIGGPRDRMKAAHWYRAAADQGSNDARNLLGEMLWRGDGIPRDDAEAFRLFLAAAQEGDIEGIFGVARAFGEGRGVERNLEEAVRLLHIAAEAEHPPAQFRLGVLYERGQGVERNARRARALIESAAAAEYEPAQRHLTGR